MYTTDKTKLLQKEEYATLFHSVTFRIPFHAPFFAFRSEFLHHKKVKAAVYYYKYVSLSKISPHPKYSSRFEQYGIAKTFVSTKTPSESVSFPATPFLMLGNVILSLMSSG